MTQTKLAGKNDANKICGKVVKIYNSTDPVLVILKSSFNIGKVVFAKATLAKLH
jgi:hypothetical protein